MIEAIQFSSFSEFLDMGGYSFNVWSVYFLFAIFISLNLIAPIRKRKRIMKDLERRVILSQRNSDGEDNDESGAITSPGPVGEST